MSNELQTALARAEAAERRADSARIEALEYVCEAAENVCIAHGMGWDLDGVLGVLNDNVRHARALLGDAAPDLLAEVNRLRECLAESERQFQAKVAEVIEQMNRAEAAERQRDEAIAASDARAEAMREVCAKAVWPYVRGLDDVVRALPIPAQEK